jgi:hypothetical protein
MDVLRVTEAEGHGHRPEDYHGGSPTPHDDGVLAHARHVGRRLFTGAGLGVVLVAVAVMVPILGREHLMAVLMGSLGLLCASVLVGGWVGESAAAARPHPATVGAFGAITCLGVGMLAAGTWSLLSDPAHLGLELGIYRRIVRPLVWGVALGGWLAAPLGGLAGMLTRRRLRG